MVTVLFKTSTVPTPVLNHWPAGVGVPPGVVEEMRESRRWTT